MEVYGDLPIAAAKVHESLSLDIFIRLEAHMPPINKAGAWPVDSLQKHINSSVVCGAVIASAVIDTG